MKNVTYYHDIADNTFYKVEDGNVTPFPSKATPRTAIELHQLALHPAASVYIINEGTFKSAGLTNLKLKV
jgi:hypothetical protein